MSIGELRKTLEEIRAHAKEGDLDQVVSVTDSALHALDGGRLLTTTEAAELLGIRSVNTLKLLVRRMGVRYELHGNRMMIPLAAIEAIQNAGEVLGLRASDRAHDDTAALSSSAGGDEQLMRDLGEARPGTLPWVLPDARATQ